jgi:cytochrome c biogenesis protein CcdA
MGPYGLGLGKRGQADLLVVDDPVVLAGLAAGLLSGFAACLLSDVPSDLATELGSDVLSTLVSDLAADVLSALAAAASLLPFSDIERLSLR